jgi:hypothetical protein
VNAHKPLEQEGFFRPRHAFVIRAEKRDLLHRENDNEKTIALRQNREQALTCLAVGSKNVPHPLLVHGTGRDEVASNRARAH